MLPSYRCDRAVTLSATPASVRYDGYFREAAANPGEYSTSLSRETLSYHCLQPLPAPGQPQPSRQISTTIQRAADDFVRLIESEKVKAREPLQRQLAALEHDHAQFREHAATTLDAALTRVGSADDEIQKVKEVLAAREKEIENMRQVVAARDRDITQLREQHMSLGAPGTDRIGGSQHQREGVELQVLRMREALEKDHNELVASKNAQIEALNAHIAKLEAELVELRSKDEDSMMAEASRDYLNMDECDQVSASYVNQ